MDLSTIRTKLQRGEYTDPWAVCDDYRLMVENACIYNKRITRVYRAALKVKLLCDRPVFDRHDDSPSLTIFPAPGRHSQMAEAFDRDIDPIMRRFGFCCGQKVCLLLDRV
jgi:hypothetical protein